MIDTSLEQRETLDIGGWMAQIIWIHQTHAFISTSRFIYDNVTRNAIPPLVSLSFLPCSDATGWSKQPGLR